MIYGYGLWNEIEKNLQKEYSHDFARNIQKYNKIKQLLGKKRITQDDFIFFLRFSEGDKKLQRELGEEGYRLFPNHEFSQFIEHRKHYLTEIDTWTNYPLKRVYMQGANFSLLSLINEHFGLAPVVLKVGNMHASQGKWLIGENRILPHLKYRQRQLEITIEEFVPHARSIRVGIVGEPGNKENYFITEHINSKTWLKNNAPEEENTYSYEERYNLNIPHIDHLIEETREIASHYQANLIGVDWVVGQEKTGILEVNDMIGLPEGEFALRLFYKHIKEIIEEYKKSNGN